MSDLSRPCDFNPAPGGPKTAALAASAPIAVTTAHNARVLLAEPDPQPAQGWRPASKDLRPAHAMTTDTPPLLLPVSHADAARAGDAPASGAPRPAERALSAPPLRRGSMTPVPWQGLKALSGRSAPASPAAPRGDRLPWEDLAARRRLILSSVMLGSAAAATAVLTSTQGDVLGSPGAWLNNALFGLLFAWVCGGFLTAVMGYVSLRRGDPLALNADAVAGNPIDPDARTAVIMPICNEDVGSVMAGLRATIESLSRAGEFDRFDVFVLSDTSKPDLRDEEQAAWTKLRADLTADGYDASRVHYRWRKRRTHKKAGNVADFCRRWGRAFRYMVVLDADSVMSGDALVTMVRVMEANPRAGIVQTAPRSCGHDSLHARVQQFAGRLTGSLFAAGLRYWQMGESHYWGHNAILRIEPFMKHCALAKLPGNGGLSGEILSHDFVEAALMRRAGYEVWLLPDLEGSYEQAPPHLIDELQRDRRWCQGNLQNARLVTEPGFAKVHRAMFVAGAMSYVASPLWLGFVLLGLLPWLAAGGATSAGAAGGLTIAAIVLWIATVAMLLLPRLLAVLLTLQRGQAALYGGPGALFASALLEALMAALQAPVRMVAHSIFVLGALTGLKLQWKSPSREANTVTWREAVGRFGVGGAVATGVLAWWLAGEPTDAWHVLPLALPLVLAVPLAVFTSRTDVGAAWRRRGWLLIPEEVQPPAVLRAAWRYAGRTTPEAAANETVQAAPGHGRAGSSGTAGATLTGWRNRALATVGLAFAAAAVVLPQQVAHGGLSASDLAAIRIVMQASSPAAEPQVLISARAGGLKRISATTGRDLLRDTVSRSITPI